MAHPRQTCDEGGDRDAKQNFRAGAPHPRVRPAYLRSTLSGRHGLRTRHVIATRDHFDRALLQADGASWMLNTAYEADECPAVPDSTRRAGHSDTTLFFGCPNVDEAYEYLRSKAVTVEKPVIRDYGMKPLTVIDPDGYGLVLSASGEGRLGAKPAAPAAWSSC